jgi:hypothetical protein
MLNVSITDTNSKEKFIYYLGIDCKRVNEIITFTTKITRNVKESFLDVKNKSIDY